MRLIEGFAVVLLLYACGDNGGAEPVAEVSSGKSGSGNESGKSHSAGSADSGSGGDAGAESIGGQGGNESASEGGSGDVPSDAGAGGETVSAGGVGGEGGQPVAGAGGAGGEVPMPPEGDPCDYPESDLFYDCAGICGNEPSKSFMCDCREATPASATLLFDAEFQAENCVYCEERAFSWDVIQGKCSRFTAMPDSGIGFSLTTMPYGYCAERHECLVVNSGTLEQNEKTIAVMSPPQWPTWVKVETVDATGGCPLYCP